RQLLGIGGVEELIVGGRIPEEKREPRRKLVITEDDTRRFHGLRRSEPLAVKKERRLDDAREGVLQAAEEIDELGLRRSRDGDVLIDLLWQKRAAPGSAADLRDE